MRERLPPLGGLGVRLEAVPSSSSLSFAIAFFNLSFCLSSILSRFSLAASALSFSSCISRSLTRAWNWARRSSTAPCAWLKWHIPIAPHREHLMWCSGDSAAGSGACTQFPPRLPHREESWREESSSSLCRRHLLVVVLGSWVVGA